jgi:hypothetical protein
MLTDKQDAFGHEIYDYFKDENRRSVTETTFKAIITKKKRRK